MLVVAAIDWVAVGGITQAVMAIVIALLTKTYADATNKIRQANDRMAKANEHMIEQMREDRAAARHERSASAAQRMTAATMEMMLGWRRAKDDPGNMVFPITEERPHGQPISADDKRRPLLSAWQNVYGTERADIEETALVEDLERFWRIVTTALTDWDAISLGDDDGDPSHELKRRPDYRTFRLNWCQKRLLDSLDAHRRGEPVEHYVLPADAGAFLSLPPGAGEDDFAALVTD